MTISQRTFIFCICALVAIPLLFAVSTKDSTRKDGDTLHLSTVKWGEVESSVPEPIMREMGLKAGQEIDDETAEKLTVRIIQHFNLEAKKSGR